MFQIIELSWRKVNANFRFLDCKIIDNCAFVIMQLINSFVMLSQLRMGGKSRSIENSLMEMNIPRFVAFDHNYKWKIQTNWLSRR